MTTLVLPGNANEAPRDYEDNDPTIELMTVNKGWVELPRPSYDSATHKAPHWDGSEWVVVAKTEEELAADAAATRAATIQAAEDAGYAVEPEGFTLALGKADRDAFTQLLTMVRLAEEMGVAAAEYPVRDKTGTTRMLTRQRLKEVLLSYGGYYAGVFFSA